MIGARADCLHLGFIHGAALPEPERLPQGHGKAKRHLDLRRRSDIRHRVFKALIRAALAYEPGP